MFGRPIDCVAMMVTKSDIILHMERFYSIRKEWSMVSAHFHLHRHSDLRTCKGVNSDSKLGIWGLLLTKLGVLLGYF